MKSIQTLFMLGQFISLSAQAASITMTLSDTCKVAEGDLQVQIMGAGYAPVSNKKVTVNVAEGTKLSVTSKAHFIGRGHPMPPVLGPWTPAKNGGVLPVTCMPNSPPPSQDAHLCRTVAALSSPNACGFFWDYQHMFFDGRKWEAPRVNDGGQHYMSTACSAVLQKYNQTKDGATDASSCSCYNC